MTDHALSLEKRLTVVGSFGFGNAGDEAVPLSILDLANHLAPDHHWAIDVVSRFDRPAMTEVIGLGPQDKNRRAQLTGQPVLFCGGGMIEARGMACLLRGRQLLDEIDTPRASVFACAVEPGVRFGLSLRRRYRRLFERMEHISVRDIRSAEALRDLAPRTTFQTLADVVLWMRTADHLPESVGALDRYIAVSLASRWSDEPAFHEWLAAHLGPLARGLDAAVVFVPCAADHDRDCAEHERVADLIAAADPDLPIIQLSSGLDPRDVAAVLGSSILTVGMRLHACIMAYAARTPFLGLAYHPKLLGFARTVGHDHAILPSDPPRRQSRRAYGYTFADISLAECDLQATGRAAIENARFDRLPELRGKLADALRSVIGLADPAPAQPVLGSG